MNSNLNIIASLASVSLGAGLLVVTLLHTRWLRQEHSAENRYLQMLVATAFLTLVADPLAFITDGCVQPVLAVLCLISNMWLYLANMLIGLSWLGVVLTHMSSGISKRHAFVIYSLSIVGVILQIVNLFYPIVFGFGEGHVYYRGPLYFYYVFLEGLYMLDGIYMYFRARRRGGIFRAFPLWQFIIPILVGLCIQSVLYGVSTIAPCLAISIFNTILGLQQDKLMRDKLTGVYNRYYLEYVKEKMSGKKDGIYVSMMADLNGFKEINDTYGHVEGDEALVNASAALMRAAGESGTVLRYAGDEFLVFVNEHSEEAEQKLQQRVKDEFDAYNRTSGKPYALSCAVGCSLIDVRNDSVDEIMQKVDRLMYEDKTAYKAANFKD